MNLKGKKKQKQEEILVKRENVAFILSITWLKILNKLINSCV